MLKNGELYRPPTPNPEAERRARERVPLLGRTPPPWRWPPDVIATSVGTHVAYVLAVATVEDTINRLARAA
jgi:hypothetical protein